MDNCLITCKRILESLKVPITGKFLKEKILTHPHYPSLLAISDTLEDYGVESMAAKLGPNRLDEIPLPGIVQVSLTDGSYFNVITAISENMVSIFDEKGKQKDVSRLDFLKSWTGVSLLVEAEEGAAEPGIDQKILDYRIIQGASVVCAVSFLLWTGFGIVEQEASGLYLLYFMIKLLGLSVSVILIWYQQDKGNPTLQKFCSGGNRVDCDEVLNSKAFQWLEGRVNPSLLAFAYFFSGIGLMSFLIPSPIAFLAWLSLATIPVVIYSFYYQAIVIKKWCRFCLLIQGVLVLEVLAVLGSGFWSVGLNAPSVFLFLSLFTGVILAGILIKPMLGQKDEIYKAKRDLAKLKSNKQLFQAALSRSRKMLDVPQGIGIMRKSEFSKYQIIKVSNPFCGPCSKMHPVLEELFDKGNIDLQILFSTSRGNKRNEKTVRHLMALAEKGDDGLIRRALDDWHDQEDRDYEGFAAKYKMNGELDLQTEKIENMEEWCLKENITYTPTLFINGYELPKEYGAEDLKYLLD